MNTTHRDSSAPEPSGAKPQAPAQDHRTDRSPGSALSTRGVKRHFGKVHAVDGVDLDVDRGEIVAILGPNGAGKTTFLDMVLGFGEPTKGRIEVLGTKPAKAVKAGRVSALLQRGGLLETLTVRDTVKMVASCHHQHIPIDDALKRSGAHAFANRRISKCSGGERQRVRFALALLTEPDLLLLDEPTAGMDVRARQQFWATMQEEAERGRTVLFATHYLQEASDFADRIVLMRKGRIIRDGTVHEVTSSGHRTLSCDWLNTVSPEEVARRFDVDKIDELPGGRLRFRTEHTDELARLLLSDGLAKDLEISGPSLDQVFLDLTDESNDVDQDAEHQASVA